MLIVPDVQDVYTPLETDVIVQLSEVSFVVFSNKAADICNGNTLAVPDKSKLSLVWQTSKYVLIVFSVVCDVDQCRQHLELLLESIPSMFQNYKTADSAFGAAVKVCYLYLLASGLSEH